MRKFLAVLTAVVLVASFGIAPAQAQAPFFAANQLNPISGASGSTTAGSVVMLVKYVGSTAGKPTVEVAAGGDITLKIAGSVDTAAGCPTVGTGIIDVSDTACNTFGEVVNAINTNTGGGSSKWRAVLLGGLASGSSDNTIAALSATDAGTNKGVALYRDDTVSLIPVVAALPPGVSTDISFFVPPQVNAKINPNAFSSFQPFVQSAAETVTEGGTETTFDVLGVTRTYDSSGNVSDVVRTIHSIPAAATTVRGAIDVGFAATPLVGAPGEMILVRYTTDTSLSAEQVFVTGFNIKVGGSR